MGGYCAMGRFLIARAPAIIIRMARTQAKIGRSIKKLDISAEVFPLLLLSGRRRCRVDLRWRDRGAGLRPLQAIDDDPVTHVKAVGHQPLVAKGAVCLDD